jgi:hypothetical protein
MCENKKNVIEIGSVLSATNDKSVALNRYEDTQKLIRHWVPPFKLTFRRAPRIKGPLWRLSSNQVTWKRQQCILKEGRLLVFEDGATDEAPTSRIHCTGLSIDLLDPEEDGTRRCFRLHAGFETIIFKADSRNEMLNWASTIYYGIAMANGGTYILALESLMVSTGKSRKEVVAGAIARMTQMEVRKQLSMLDTTTMSAEEISQIEKEIMEGVMEDEERIGMEADDAEDTADGVREVVRDVLDDMISVLLHNENSRPEEAVVEDEEEMDVEMEAFMEPNEALAEPEAFMEPDEALAEPEAFMEPNEALAEPEAFMEPDEALAEPEFEPESLELMEEDEEVEVEEIGASVEKDPEVLPIAPQPEEERVEPIVIIPDPIVVVPIKVAPQPIEDEPVVIFVESVKEVQVEPVIVEKPVRQPTPFEPTPSPQIDPASTHRVNGGDGFTIFKQMGYNDEDNSWVSLPIIPIIV